MIKYSGYIFLALLIHGCSCHYYVDSGRQVDIILDHPVAKKVLFASSLDGFEPHETNKINGGWVISLPSDRSFQYFYVVDERVFIPACSMKENDDFGSHNCIYAPKP